jgi:hypothetical protein
LRQQGHRRFFLRRGRRRYRRPSPRSCAPSLVESSGGAYLAAAAGGEGGGATGQVTVNVQITANVFAMRKILHAIESHTPYLFIDNLVVRSQVPGTSSLRRAANPRCSSSSTFPATR